MREIDPLLTKPDFCRSVILQKRVKLKNRMLTLRLAGKDLQLSRFRLLAMNSSIRDQERQCIHQGRPQVPRRYPRSWNVSQAAL